MTEEKPTVDKTKLEMLREIHTVQGYDGNWTYSEYMWGLYNGLELALALFENREPKLKDKPKRFGSDPEPPEKSFLDKLRSTWGKR